MELKCLVFKVLALEVNGIFWACISVFVDNGKLRSDHFVVFVSSQEKTQWSCLDSASHQRHLHDGCRSNAPYSLSEEAGRGLLDFTVCRPTESKMI